MSKSLKDTPLGQQSEYVDTYSPSLLYPVARAGAREGLGLDADELPFQGEDIWHAYEISWLNQRGKPVVAMAEFRVPCDSQNIVESKSFKLYLNSFANSHFETPRAVAATLEKDLSACAGGAVGVTLEDLEQAAQHQWIKLPGTLLDELDVELTEYNYNPELLKVKQGVARSGEMVSHLLRSRCPVTGQPDWATLIVRFTGSSISPEGLLRYLVSLRNHEGFHEQIIERIWLDLMQHCKPRQLSVYGRFTRRGGLDINPFRSNFEAAPVSLRTVRQ